MTSGIGSAQCVGYEPTGTLLRLYRPLFVAVVTVFLDHKNPIFFLVFSYITHTP